MSSPWRWLIAISLCAAANAQQAKAPPSQVAGIPVNYDEAKVGTYTLPDPLVLADGEPVRDAKTWVQKRRPEIVRLFEENQFGRSPGRPAGMTFDVFEKGTPAFDGKAIRRQVTVHFFAGKSMNLLLYLPASARKPVPFLLHLSFSANSTTVDDPGVKEGEVWGPDKKRIPANQGRKFPKVDVVPLLEAGFGFGTIYYGDIDPDFAGGIQYGVRGQFLKPGQTAPAPDEWGTIGAWAWGLQPRDGLSGDRQERGCEAGRNPGRIEAWENRAVGGSSRYSFRAGDRELLGRRRRGDQRRDYGETIAHLTTPSRYPYQFCANYGKFAEHVDRLPVDANMLVALMAPRPVLLQTGDKDFWSDPKGEFLAAVAAGPVFELFGERGLNTDQMPPAGTGIFHAIGYFEHIGGHGTIPSDWDQYLKFLEMHLQR